MPLHVSPPLLWAGILRLNLYKGSFATALILIRAVARSGRGEAIGPLSPLPSNLSRHTQKIWPENGKIQTKFQNFFACTAYRHRRRYIVLDRYVYFIAFSCLVTISHKFKCTKTQNFHTQIFVNAQIFIGKIIRKILQIPYIKSKKISVERNMQNFFNSIF